MKAKAVTDNRITQAGASTKAAVSTSLIIITYSTKNPNCCMQTTANFYLSPMSWPWKSFSMSWPLEMGSKPWKLLSANKTSNACWWIWTCQWWMGVRRASRCRITLTSFVSKWRGKVVGCSYNPRTPNFPTSLSPPSSYWRRTARSRRPRSWSTFPSSKFSINCSQK